MSNACNEWPETAAHYTCAKVNETAFENSPNLGCSPNRVHKGRCLVTGWSTPAPRAAYRYFGNNQGGMSADLDYCPIIGPAGYVWTDDTGKPTADPGTTWTACNVIGDEPEVNSLFEETGPASRCLEAQPTGSSEEMQLRERDCTPSSALFHPTFVGSLLLESVSLGGAW